jgi:nicotinamide mononucleotide adenylyltransferase
MVQWKQNKDIAYYKTALIPMACRPFHKGHYNLILKAFQENKHIKCYVSNVNRIRKNEVPVYATTMRHIWDEIITPLMPENLEIIHCNNPIKSVWEYLDECSKEESSIEHTIYGDVDDVQTRFSEQLLDKYVPDLLYDKLIKIRPVPREETENISGTSMRQWLAEDDYNRFCMGLPKQWDYDVDKQIWDLLYNDMLTSGFTQKSPQIDEQITDYLIELFEIAPDMKDWTHIKWQLTRSIPHEYRALFSKRQHKMKTQHPNLFERELMKLWVELSEKPLTYYIDNEEHTLNP